MGRNKSVVIGGAGAGGLAAGLRLIKSGYDVVVLEKRRRHCEVQSGSKGGQARLHGGAFYAGLEIARAIRGEAVGLSNAIPDAVKEVKSVYFVPKKDLKLIISGCKEAQIRFDEHDAYASLLSPDFCTDTI
jgi:glycine/D-amino acid oxidase-like deaminating enzyme